MNNWDFGGDESLFLLVSSLAGVIGAVRWYAQLLRIPSLRRHGIGHAALALTPVVALAGLLIILRLGADPARVAGQVDYTLLFLAGGLMWLWLASFGASLLGVSVRDDALERRNPAAVWACCGALLGGEATYALSNIGSGATIWMTLLPATIAFATWMTLWLVVEVLSRPSDAIALDRDSATGVRQGLYLIASGLVLGRAMVGDWKSWSGTLADFAHEGWPALLLAAGIVRMNHVLRPQPERPQRHVLTDGLVAGGVLLAGAIGALVFSSMRRS